MLYASCFTTLAGITETFTTNLIGTAYPLYQTIQTLDEDKRYTPFLNKTSAGPKFRYKRQLNGDHERFWLTYWAIFAIFLLIDTIVGEIVLKKVVPFYFAIKIMFLIYLFHPKTLGAKNVYENLIEPLAKNKEMLL